MVDDRDAILYDCKISPYKRDIEGLPHVVFARLLRSRIKKSVNSARMMAGDFCRRVGLYLYFVPSAQVNAAV